MRTFPLQQLQHIRLAIFDLDNTLYTADAGVFERMDKRMTSFIQRKLQLDYQQANNLRLQYWQEYGTTLRGLMLHHQVDPEDFLEDVHNIQAHEILSHSPTLQQALQQLTCRKVIHTNGTREHAERITNTLGIRQYFDAIYDIRFNDYQPKPCSATLQQLLQYENIAPQHTLVIDDMPDNLQAAQEVGTMTCLIDHTQNTLGDWHFQAASIESWLLPV